jgi:hypothetical protein
LPIFLLNGLIQRSTTVSSGLIGALGVWIDQPPFVCNLAFLLLVSMLTKEAGKEIYAMYRLVQLFIHVWLNRHSQKPDYQKKALSQLADRFLNGKHKNRALYEMLFPHARAILRYKFNNKPS